MYCPYQNWSIYESCASTIQLATQNMFDSFGWKSLLVNHLLVYGMVLEAKDVSVFLLLFSI